MMGAPPRHPPVELTSARRPAFKLAAYWLDVLISLSGVNFELKVAMTFALMYGASVD